jgi:putative endonuclease
MKYYLYVLKSLKDEKLYIGVTSNVTRRLQEHNSGKNKSTKPRRPFILVYKEEFCDRHAAYKYEWYVKNTGSGNIELKQKLGEVAKVVTAGV